LHVTRGLASVVHNRDQTWSRNFKTRQYDCHCQNHARSSRRSGDQDAVATLRKHERFLSNNRTGSAGAGNPTAERPETCSLVSVVQGTANRSLEQRLYLSQSWSEEPRRLRFIFGRA